MKSLLFFITAWIAFPLFIQAQTNKITVSGLVRNSTEKKALAFVNVVLKSSKDSSFVLGTITNEEGRFALADIKSGSYYLEFQLYRL